MALFNQIASHAKLLKVPLLITVVVLALLALGALLFHGLRPAGQPAIVEAPMPAAKLGSIVFYRDGEQYALYFSLYDEAGQEVARTGDVTVKISQLGTIGVEGGSEFLSETVVLESQFEVGLAAYRWLEVGEGWFFQRKRLAIPKRVPPEVFKKIPRTGARCKISVQFRDGHVVESRLRQERLFLFP